MTVRRIILVERIRHDPLAGSLTGVAIRREAGGLVSRHRITTSVDAPALTHAQATERLLQRAEHL
ncbi:hypothetical protein [Jannaschia sp. 2305UL9-9]|uniref:hypothetical protein n=1 Tax=Jannaschia sp. 2305UL9-9 TaxID=3121638 RepID=UPI003527CCD9